MMRTRVREVTVTAAPATNLYLGREVRQRYHGWYLTSNNASEQRGKVTQRILQTLCFLQEVRTDLIRKTCWSVLMLMFTWQQQTRTEDEVTSRLGQTSSLPHCTRRANKEKLSASLSHLYYIQTRIIRISFSDYKVLGFISDI